MPYQSPNSHVFPPPTKYIMFLISCFSHAYQYSIQQNHGLLHNDTFIPVPFKHTYQAWPYTMTKENN